MRRRAVITLLGGSMVAWPSTLWAQPTERIRVIGALMSQGNDSRSQANLAQLRDALQQLGWVDGRNVRLEVRWAGGEMQNVQAFALELAKLSPDIILAVGTSAIAALKKTTQSIPLVFVIVNDPVAQGFVSSLAHPGGNITGFSYMDYSVLEKALQLLQQVSPRIDRVGFMFNPDTYPYYEVYLQKLGGSGRQLGFDLMALRVRSEAEIAKAFKDLTSARGTGLIVPPEPFTSAHRRQIVDLAAQHGLPATYGLRDFVVDGGLMCYAPDISDIFGRSATYIDRVLKGALPGELPVQSPTKTIFVINLKTAKTLGISIPANLLALADEVIEELH
jgi:putative tryptophan/tyrosine transport system substrate-binding protein